MLFVVGSLAALLVANGVASAAEGATAMVSSEHRLASDAGVEILRQGGNAVDAAVAVSLAVCVVNPSSCGIGGGGFMVIFERGSRTVSALDYRETAPAAARRDMFVRDGSPDRDLSIHGGLAAAVPGEVAGLDAALRRFGSLPWPVVAAPAIRYARDGFAIEAHLADAIARNRERLAAVPALASLLLRPDGTPLRTGDVLRQPALAGTLERVATRGPVAFYAGAVASSIVRSVEAAGGILTLDDLNAYRPVWRTPVHGRFHGHDVWSMPPPSSGGGLIVQVLNTIASDRLVDLGHDSPTYVHLLAEAMRFAFADRAALYGDPGFADVPLARLLSKDRGHRLRHTLSAAATFSPPFYGERFVDDDHGTSHLSVVDPHGNAVACTTSINTAFGSMVLAEEAGVLMNDTMDDFTNQPGASNVYGLIGSDANAIAPGKRPLSSMTPTVVTREGTAMAVLGGSGGPLIISATLQVLLNGIVFGMDAASSVAAPRLHHQWMPPILLLEPAVAAEGRNALRRLGHRVVDGHDLGAVQLVRRSRDGRLEGAADPRKGGEAAGW
jgi:gamma-glutamyltranspeptidase/glutathione hydrolase